MSAIPKKKLCWNCDGNIEKLSDNCPYCGVYLHTPPADEDDSWNPPYKLSLFSKEDQEEIPAPHYQAQEEEAQADEPATDVDSGDNTTFTQFRSEILPIILLLAGSSFFLFGTVLLLFSHNGTLILQWNGSNWIYFLLLALPCVFLGWRSLGQNEEEA